MKYFINFTKRTFLVLLKSPKKLLTTKYSYKRNISFHFYLSISACLPARLSIYLSICLYVSLSLCLSEYILLNLFKMQGISQCRSKTYLKNKQYQIKILNNHNLFFSSSFKTLNLYFKQIEHTCSKIIIFAGIFVSFNDDEPAITIPRFSEIFFS